MLGGLFNKLRYKLSAPESRPTYAARHLGVKVGEGCIFFGSVNFGSEPYLVSLGSQVMLSDNVRFITHDGGIRVLDNMGILPKADVFGSIRVGDNVFIGMDCIILRGVTIGDNVVVGAGSIVTRDIESNSVWAGIPARRIKSIEEYASGLKTEALPVYGMQADDKEAFIRKHFAAR